MLYYILVCGALPPTHNKAMWQCAQAPKSRKQPMKILITTTKGCKVRLGGFPTSSIPCWPRKNKLWPEGVAVATACGRVAKAGGREPHFSLNIMLRAFFSPGRIGGPQCWISTFWTPRENGRYSFRVF